MKEINNNADVKSDTENQNQTKKHRLPLFVLLLIFCTLSSCLAGYLIGRTVDVTGYSGQIIDTILISPGEWTENPPSQVYTLNLRGRVSYSDGSPFRNGTVELKSEPKYTATDSNGAFVFENVEPGSHTISVIQNSAVLAFCTLTVERTSQSAGAKVIKFDNGNFLVQISLEIEDVDIALELNGETLTATLGISAEPDSEPSGNPAAPEQPAAGDEPEGTDTPALADEPEGTDTPAPTGEPVGTDNPVPIVEPEGDDGASGTSDPRDSAPEIIAGDDYNPYQVWTQVTSVDIFAPRTDNSGVKTVGGYTVISPGAAGKYIFKLKNPEQYPVEYSVKLDETDQNNPNLPLQYRLKASVSGSDYIGGSDWKNAGNIPAASAALSAGETTYFTLEWKWVTSGDSIDTDIGMQDGDPVYILNITISAQYK